MAKEKGASAWRRAAPAARLQELGERSLQGIGGDVAHIGHDVGIGVHRLGDRRVAQLVLDDLRADVLPQQATPDPKKSTALGS